MQAIFYMGTARSCENGGFVEAVYFCAATERGGIMLAMLMLLTL